MSVQIKKNADNTNSDEKQKFVEKRVIRTENYIGDLCAEFVAYTRRTSKLRNNGDEISQILLRYSENEELNHTCKVALRAVAKHIASGEDHRSCLTDRLLAKVINPLAHFGVEFKSIKLNLRNAFTTRKKEESKVATLEKLKDNNSSDNVKITKARNELERASLDASKSSTELEKEILVFEKKKIVSMKSILRDFLQMEMMWHARALECYSRAIIDLEQMNEEEDLEEFRASLRPNSIAMDGRLNRHRSASQNSLGSTNSLNRRPPVPHARSADSLAGTANDRKPAPPNANGTPKTPTLDKPANRVHYSDYSNDDEGSYTNDDEESYTSDGDSESETEESSDKPQLNKKR